MLTLELVVQGIGWWTPRCAGWPAARAALGVQPWPDGPPQRPAPTLLPANERRRAPDAVLMALQVADEACTMAGADRAAVASVFTSAHGDLAVVDALCRTLADPAALLSPLRFHHSVHNAAAGYWAIGAANSSPGLALAGGAHSFALGLMEAACQCAADQRPVLLVGCDTEAQGPLRSVNRSRGALALALLLAPAGAAGRTLRLTGPQAGAASRPQQAPAAIADHPIAHNAIADGLPLFAALAGPGKASLPLALGPHAALDLAVGAA